MNQSCTIEFQMGTSGINTPEEFLTDLKDLNQYILNSRYQMVSAEIPPEQLPVMPIIVAVLFEDGTTSNCLIHPHDEEEKKTMLVHAKAMLASFGTRKRIVCAAISSEAWVTKVDISKEAIPFKNELTEAQLRLKALSKHRREKAERETKMIFNLQFPGEPHKLQVEIYSLFEHRLMILDEDSTLKANTVQNPEDVQVSPEFDLFKDQGRASGAMQFTLPSAVKYLQGLNAYL